MMHEAQHPDNPTWCIHCGEFDPDPGEACDAERIGEFDSRKSDSATRMFADLFGLDTAPK
jgi:hypothetical protein